MGCTLSFLYALAHAFNHFPYYIFLIWASFCPTFIYYFDKTLNAAAVSQKPLPKPKTPQTFQFPTEQLTKFVANMVIQIAQPQVRYPNPKQDMLDSKSSMCRKIPNVANTNLGVNITGKDLFESIDSLSAPATHPPPKKSHSHLRAPKLSPNPSQNHSH